MAGELLIVFVYDTEVCLREEEDPQTAIVFFHPSWVSGNQRMALCGQLIGVTQFLIADFDFPQIICLNCGKFAMQQIGRFILCVGTDRNIPDWIVVKRCKILCNTLEFFHANLSYICKNSNQINIAEKLANAMEVYLPVLLFAGNVFGNTPTIRLPKSASSIFLEAAQLLECLQDNRGIHGGAIFYQNKVVMSQLSTEITKQIVMTDPCRIKIPAENVNTTFQLPLGVQLLLVYIDKAELNLLQKQKIPSIVNRKVFNKFQKENYDDSNAASDTINTMKKNKPYIFAVVEEDNELENSSVKADSCLLQMPDVVKDTVKISNLKKKDKFSEINVDSYLVDCNRIKIFSSYSNENLQTSPLTSATYFSFKKFRFCEDKIKALDIQSQTKANFMYYNTIADPVNPWFRFNGLPVSKALRNDQIILCCQQLYDEESNFDDQIKSVKMKNKFADMSEIKITKKELKKLPKPTSLSFNIKNEFLEKGNYVSHSSVEDVPVTPLMSKLNLLQLSEGLDFEDLLTPVSSNYLNEETFPISKNTRGKFKQLIWRNKFCHKKSNSYHLEKFMEESILFTFGHQNISFYLLMDIECGRNADLIYFLWKSCFNGSQNLEKHFKQCFESIPQNHISIENDAYSYLNIHSTWETLCHGGSWNISQLDIINLMQNDFNNDLSLTDFTIRFEDSVIYGNQIADNHVFYLQNVGSIAGLPTPSDLMGVISLKAKRRLERDYGLIIM